MKKILFGAVAAAALLSVYAAGAQALPIDATLKEGSLVESAACTVRRVRTVRPNGTVVVRRVRKCGPRMGMGMGCRMVTQRVKRPNGTVIVRRMRRCG